MAQRGLAPPQWDKFVSVLSTTPASAAAVLETAQRHAGNRAIQRLLSSDPNRYDTRTAERRGRPTVAQRLAATSGRGQPLDTGTRRRLETGLGADLGAVRVHTGGEADGLAHSVGAKAFTSGTDIFFRNGSYDPSSREGLRVLAHESTHVVQQAAGPVSGVPTAEGVAVSEPDDAFEHAADATAQRIVDHAFAPSTGGRPGDAPALQRACECGGTCGGCGPGREDDATNEPAAPVQRTVAAAAGALPVIQRLTDPLGPGQVVDWDPKAVLTRLDSKGKTLGPLPGDFAGGETAEIGPLPRNEVGLLNFPVTANWRPSDGPVPPPPQRKCDACTALQGAATQATTEFVCRVVGNMLSFPLSLFKGLLCRLAAAIVKGLVGDFIKILPDDLVKKCAELDIDEVIRRVKQIKQGADDQDCNAVAGVDLCKVADGISRAIRRARIPIFGPLILMLADDAKKEVFRTVSETLTPVLRDLQAARRKCGRPGPGPGPAQAAGRGTAVSTMRVRVFITADGQVRTVGGAPAQMVSGTGATQLSPVPFTHDAVPPGAFVAQVPTMQASGPDGAKASREFGVNVAFEEAPQPFTITCPTARFDRFKVASDRFENENQRIRDIHDWYFGLDPEIRNTIENQESVLKITGRASNTGSVEFNQKLGEKRAKHVAQIIDDFSGSDSHIRSFSLGLLAAKEKGEKGEERRADVEIKGVVPAERVAKMKGDPCTGHQGETSDEGASGPVSAPEPEPVGALGPGGFEQIDEQFERIPVTAGAAVADGQGSLLEDAFA